MENKDQNGTPFSEGSNSVLTPSEGALHAPPPDSNDLSLEPHQQAPLLVAEQPKGKVHRFFAFARRLDIMLAALLLIVGAVVLFNVFSKNRQENSSPTSTAANRFGTVKIPLGELVSGKDLSLADAANVTINGSMQLNNSLILAPSLQPTGAKAGQLYYDQGTNQLAYFNGEVFVFLTSPSPDSGGVQSLGGGTGQLTLGDGLALTNGELNNSGVLSVQGETGNVTFTAGPGLVINGTTFSSSGVLTIASGSPNISVTDDGNGGVTISMTSGAGTLTSSGGTPGQIPLFTAAQNVEDSIISQSGLTVTISGDLSVVTGGLSLSNALTVSNGGTGATSLASNGVIVGQGTAALTSVAAGGAGLCLISTAGLPAWGACPGGGGVTSLNGLSGGLSIANASGAGSTITIDNASTSAKGIASFNATNFSVSSGAVNTIQNINTGATPTFAGLNTNSITPSAALTIGSTGQSLTLQGSAATTLTATNGANTTALAFVTPTANVTYRLQTASAGTYDICTTTGNCAGTAGGVTTPGGTTNRLAKFTGSQIIGDSIIVDNGSNVDIGGTLSVQGNTTLTGDIAVNGGDLTSAGALNITPGGILTVGVTGQQLTLQGNASTTLAATNSGNTTTVTFQTPTANVTYRLPTAAAGTYDVCTTVGNCAGSGGGVTTSGGTTNRLAKFSGSQSIDNSTISDDGSNVTTSVDLIIQGGDVTVGVASSQTGSIRLAHSGSAFLGTFLQGSLTADRTYTLPDADGTICLTSGNCSGAGSPNTLQAAYDAGNTITTVTTRDISFTLADSATDANFIVTAATGATGYVGIVRADGAGTADPAQLLLLDNLDTNRLQPIGLKIQAAGGGMTTAIDLTDVEIATAISIAANDIVGTTGNIDLSNFDVVGATGNVTASGTINGQTISSAASFTGTVAVTGNTTLTGDIAVNGGDLTASGALNITPGGTLTAGVTGQQLILQGNANTQLTATGGGFTTTIGFNGTPTGAITYNFDRAAAAGTYTICTTIGNCAGTGGGVTTPGGSTGTIAKFTGSQTLGDSLLSESGSTVTVNGNLNLISGNQFQVNGTQISSGNLSNDANLAKLNASQTFTGNTVAFQNGTNSTNAFNVQNAAGSRIITVDSSNALVTLGLASTLDGRLVFSNVSNANTVTIVPGTPTGNRTLTLPDASGIICTDSGNCAGAGATLQTAYNFSVGGTTPKIKVNSSLGGVDIQDADTPTGANLLNIRASNGSGLGSVLFGVSNTGAVTLQNSANSTAAFRLLTAGGTSILTGDTTNGQLLLGQSSTLSGTIVFRNATNTNTITLTSGTATTGRTISLPDADGTICLTSGNCSGSGSSNTLQAAYDAGNTITTTSARNIAFSLADTATDANFLVDLQCDTSCSTNGRFAVQDDGVDTFSIGPSGSVLFKNSANSTTAFRVQNAAGSTTVLNVDTTNARVGIGTAAPSQALDVNGNINIPVTSTTAGAILQNGALLIHTEGEDDTTSFYAGVGAGNLTNTGYENVGIGAGALQAVTTGFYNVAVGSGALASNTEGEYNTAVGLNALEANIDGWYNSAVGERALISNTSGFENTAVGADALFDNTTGEKNTAVGVTALGSNETGDWNTAMGYHTLLENTAGFNSAFGGNTLSTNETGTNNSAFGVNALQVNVSGSSNAAFGVQALQNSTATANTAFGMAALLSTTSGANNVAVGYGAGYTSNAANANTTGNSNTYIGHLAGPGSSTQYSNSSAIGAFSTIHQSDSMELGCFAGINGCTTSTKIGIANTVPGFLLHVGGGAVTSGTSVARFENAGGSCTVTPNTAGGITCTSDERLKKNIQGFGGALDILNQIDVKQYNMRVDPEGSQQQIGVIAQQLEKVLPSLVNTDDQGYKSVAYSGLTPVLLQAIKEQQQQIDELRQGGDDKKNDGAVAGATASGGGMPTAVGQWAPLGITLLILALVQLRNTLKRRGEGKRARALVAVSS